MSVSKFQNKLLSLLAEELETYIPQFKPFTSDYQMLLYASKDLEIWLKVKMDTDDNRMIYESLEEEFRTKPNDLRFSINFWSGMWLKKWRERVRVFSPKFEIPKNHIERIEKAKKIYQNMDYRIELKKMAIRKLINYGEICMVEPIAENLIIEEIAKYVRKESENSIVIAINPLSLYSAVNSRIARLPEERGPLIYLNIKPNMF